MACQLAQRFGAHLEGLHVKPSPEDLIMAAGAGFGMPLPAEWIDQVNADAAATAAKTREAFMACAARHQIPVLADGAGPQPGCSVRWREDVGYAADVVSRRARFFDLTILGRSERVVDLPSTDSIEQALIHSGRPVLIAPAQMPQSVGERIAIGWNGAPEAVRVVVAALPLLARAKAVFIIQVGDKHQTSAKDLGQYLAWQGVAATLRHVPTVSGAGPGSQLLSAARDEGSDLLAMGGFGHTPWRELLLGGASREIVGASLLPVLMAH
jgi:nucleotide-binding universal stress UspA family protein